MSQLSPTSAAAAAAAATAGTHTSARARGASTFNSRLPTDSEDLLSRTTCCRYSIRRLEFTRHPAAVGRTSAVSRVYSTKLEVDNLIARAEEQWSPPMIVASTICHVNKRTRPPLNIVAVRKVEPHQQRVCKGQKWFSGQCSTCEEPRLRRDHVLNACYSYANLLSIFNAVELCEIHRNSQAYDISAIGLQ